MLIGFFKDKDETCSCIIEKFTDRVWITNTDGDTRVLRSFVLENKDSTSITGEFSKISFVVPYRNVLELRLLNKMCFDENLFFNLPQIHSTQTYNIKKMPNLDGKSDDYGIIDNDGISDIKVFLAAKLDCTQLQSRYGVCSIIEVVLPSGITLKPGEKTEFRLSFLINSLLDKIDSATTLTPRREIVINYFQGYGYKREIGYLGKTNEVKLLPLYNKETTSGGIDIFIYVNSLLEKVDGFENKFKPSWHDKYDVDGKEGLTDWEKYLFRPRHIYPEKDMIGMGDEVSIIGKFVEKYDVKGAITNISSVVEKIDDKVEDVYQKTNIESQRNKHKFIWSVTIAGISLIITVTFTLLRIFKVI